MCVYIEIYFKVSTHMIWRPSKSKICRVGWQTGDSGRNCNLSLKAVGRQNSFLLGDISLFLLRSSSD